MQLNLSNIYGQRDERWANILLGYNKSGILDAFKHEYNISWYGCLIACLGILVDKHPDEVNNILKDGGGFSKDSGEFIWPKCTLLGLTQDYVSPEWLGPATIQGMDKAKEYLDNGYPLLCEIDFNPATNGEEMHFVLIIGYDGDKFIIADPWTGMIESLDKYGGFQRALIQYRVYNKKFSKGEEFLDYKILYSDCQIELKSYKDDRQTIADRLKVQNSMDIILPDLDKLMTLEETLIQKDKLLKESQDNIKTLEEKLKSLTEDHSNLIKDREKLSSEFKDYIDQSEIRFKKYKDDSEIRIQEQGSELTKAIEQLEDLKKQSQKPVLKGWKLKLYNWLIKSK